MSDVRLIDANSFKRFLQFLCKAGAPYDDVIKLLDKEPTIYNLEKVVEELERKKRTSVECLGERNGTGFNKVMDLAIDIVKRGGVE